MPDTEYMAISISNSTLFLHLCSNSRIIRYEDVPDDNKYLKRDRIFNSVVYSGLFK